MDEPAPFLAPHPGEYGAHDQKRRVDVDPLYAIEVFRLDGTHALCGTGLDERVLDGLEELVRDQIMSMKTTFTPGHYRRRVAGVLARRLVRRLFDAS